MACVFPLLPGETINQFINRELRPDERANSRYSRIIDELVNFLQQHMPYSVGKVEKGGSLGKGTHLRNSAEMDLTVFVTIKNCSSVSELYDQLPSLLEETDRKLTSTWGWRSKLTPGKSASDALYYTLTYEDMATSLVISFAMDPFASGKNKFDVLEDMYRSPPKVQPLYIACLVKQQADFVAPIPVRVKDLILLLKWWARERGLDLEPLFLELVAIDKWKKNGAPQTFDLPRFFQLTIQALQSCDTIQILWPDIWPLGTGGTPVNTTPPCVWNPATPLHNVAPRENANQEVRNAALKTLEDIKRNPVLAGWEFGQSLTVFIDAQVRPKTDELRGLGQAVDSIVQYLHQFNSSVPGKDYRIKEVVQSGSLGKGTAVQNKMDIDLIAFMQAYNSMDIFVQELPSIIQHLEKYLGERDGIEVKMPSNRYMVKCSLKLSGKRYDLDILPAIDKLGNMSKDSIRAVHAEIMRAEGSSWEGRRSYYSVCLAKLQLQFVKGDGDPNSKVKDLIRLVKYWSKDRNLGKYIVSYSLELLCIDVYRTFRGNDGITAFNMDQLFREVLRKLKNIEDLRVSFNDFYQTKDYISQWEVPYVMDPANPVTNTLYYEQDKRQIVAKTAADTLQKLQNRSVQ